MKIIGIIGGIASGKSFLSSLFDKLDVKTFYADKQAHEVLNELSVLQQVQKRWGTDIVGPDGMVNRKKLATIVFPSDTNPVEKAQAERRYLESILYPAILNRFDQFCESERKQGANAVILDAALLLESGWSKLCDTIIFVDTPDEVRIHRAVTTRGWTEEEFRAREASQLPLDEKRAKAQFVIPGDVSEEEGLRIIKSVGVRASHPLFYGVR